MKNQKCSKRVDWFTFCCWKTVSCK